MVGMGHGSANQPFEQEARQVPAGIEDRHDSYDIQSIRDRPRSDRALTGAAPIDTRGALIRYAAGRAAGGPGRR